MSRLTALIFLVSISVANIAFAKSGTEHIADMCSVFGVCRDHPRLSSVFRTITSEMDDGRTGRQKYTLNQKMKDVEPSFKWGLYTHRLFFHWGFNGNPKDSMALTEKINESTQDAGRRERLWKVVLTEQSRRNKRMMNVTETATSYIGADGKRKGFAKRDVINGIAALAYDTHIIGDYVEGKDVPMKALVPLQKTQEDIVKAVCRITDNDPDFTGRDELKFFELQMRNAQGGIEKIRAEKVLLIMKEHIPGILMKAGTFRRVLELDKYSVQTEMRQAA